MTGRKSTTVKPSPAGAPAVAPRTMADVPIDMYRAFIFPNRMRELRSAAGHPKLLPFAAKVPEIPYIRLSKIERGEVVARADELRRIAAALGIEPAELLVNIDDKGFDIARWAEPFQNSRPTDLGEERFAVLLAAALRTRRANDAELSIAVLEQAFGLPPVNLSRVENAQKTFGRWSAATHAALLKIFDAASEASLRATVRQMFESGALDAALAEVGGPHARMARSRARIAALSAALEAAPDGSAPARMSSGSSTPQPGVREVRHLAVFGAPLASGLIADTPSGQQIEAPSAAGPAAFGLKVFRATLGPGLPAQATVVLDPDRYPVAGGLAAVREDDAWRILAVTSQRDGRLIGYAVNPECEIALDDVEPARLAAVVAAYLP